MHNPSRGVGIAYEAMYRGKIIQRQKMAMLLLYRVLQYLCNTSLKRIKQKAYCFLVFNSKFAPTEAVVM